LAREELGVVILIASGLTATKRKKALAWARKRWTKLQRQAVI
jgi:hypothetical protein